MEGRIRKALIGLSATSTAVLLGRRWVHARSEGAALTGADLHGDHDDEWHLKVRLRAPQDELLSRLPPAPSPPPVPQPRAGAAGAAWQAPPS